eukprot:scaffold308730_cov30-Tisochrysis_lutea.AAC.2
MGGAMPRMDADALFPWATHLLHVKHGSVAIGGQAEIAHVVRPIGGASRQDLAQGAPDKRRVVDLRAHGGAHGDEAVHGCQQRAGWRDVSRISCQSQRRSDRLDCIAILGLEELLGSRMEEGGRGRWDRGCIGARGVARGEYERLGVGRLKPFKLVASEALDLFHRRPVAGPI